MSVIDPVVRGLVNFPINDPEWVVTNEGGLYVHLVVPGDRNWLACSGHGITIRRESRFVRDDQKHDDYVPTVFVLADADDADEWFRAEYDGETYFGQINDGTFYLVKDPEQPYEIAALVPSKSGRVKVLCSSEVEDAMTSGIEDAYQALRDKHSPSVFRYLEELRDCYHFGQTGEMAHFPTLNAGNPKDDEGSVESIDYLMVDLIGSTNTVLMRDGNYFHCTYDDLTAEGKQHYDAVKRRFEGYGEPVLLTWLDT